MRKLCFSLSLLVVLCSGASRRGQNAFIGSVNPAAGGFTYTSTVFNSDVLSRGANLTGIADSKNGLLSFWIKITTLGVKYNLLSGNDTAKFKAWIGTDNLFNLRCNDSGATAVFTCETTIALSSGWHHVIVSWAMAASPQYSMYLDGVDQMTSYVHNNTTVDYTALTDWDAGGLAGDEKLDGLLCEVWFTIPASYFDLSNASNRDKFRNGTIPADLGATGSTPTGTQPLVYFRNAYATFQNNLGSGGNFSVSGTLADGGADKP